MLCNEPYTPLTLKTPSSWRICTPSNTWFPGSTRLSIPNGILIDRFSHFCTAEAGRSLKLPLPIGYVDFPYNTWFLGPTQADNQNGISIGSAVFVGLTTVADRPTDHATPGGGARGSFLMIITSKVITSKIRQSRFVAWLGYRSCLWEITWSQGFHRSLLTLSAYSSVSATMIWCGSRSWEC